MDGCSAASCNFGVLTGEDECMAFCYTIFYSMRTEDVKMHKPAQGQLPERLESWRVDFPTDVLFCLELPGVQAGFRKGRGTRDQIANIHWIIKKARKFQKSIYSALLMTPKPLTVWITKKMWKILKQMEYQTIWTASWEICMQVKKQQLELAWNNRLVPNRERSMSRLYIVTLFI